MPHQWICSRGHRWEAVVDSAAAAAPGAACPTCGDVGTVWQSDLDGETIVQEFGSLAPTEVPSLIAPLPAARDPSSSSGRMRAAPLRIGNYEVVTELGRGGMGVVYLARHRELDRFVAIKMLLAGEYATDESVRRLHTEAEAVARLQHPNVVQIYDVGEHDGQQYLVLEYVEGGSLARSIAGKPQPPRVAAQLILTLSRTIDHAHASGIVHRDLTPSNVLLQDSAVRSRKSEVGDRKSEVRGRPEGPSDLRPLTSDLFPKLTDFGLAKRLDDEAAHTRTGSVMGTPSYMAPEQASGNVQQIGPACDIYALGAILYELLTGRPPFVGETALETLEQVLRQEPVPPTRLQPRVSRDLETICLKCLEKDSAKRYATAAALAEDLERLLSGEAILARRAGPAARLLRWSRRRPAVAALILISVFASAALVAGSFWSSALVRAERDRAEENFRLALKAVDGMLTEVGEVDFAYEPRLDEKRRALLERALALYREFLARQTDDTRLQLETAQAFRRVGDIERWLGDQEQAKDAYVEAIQLLDRLRTDQPSNLTYSRWLAYCHNWLGEVHRVSSNPQLAEQAYGRAWELSEALHREFPATVEYAQELARAQYNAGILYRKTNRPGEAERTLSQFAGLLRSLAAQDSGDASLRQELARVHINLGTLFRATGRPAQAIEQSDAAIELLAALADQFPQRPDYRLELAIVHANRGNIHARNGEPGRGRDDYEQASTLLTKLIADYPSAPALRQELANTCNSLAAMQASTGDLAGAEETWTGAVGILRELVAQHASAPVYRADLGMTLGNLGWALAEQKRFDQARQMLDDGIRQLGDVLRSNPEHPDYGLSFRSQLKELGRVLLETSDHVAAAEAARRLANHGASGNDALAAACLMVRAAAAAEQDSRLSDTDCTTVVERYCEEAAALVQAAAAQGVSDRELLESARGIFQPKIDRHEGPRAAYGLLFGPSSTKVPEQEPAPTP